MKEQTPPTLTIGARKLRLSTNLGILNGLTQSDPSYWYHMSQVKADSKIIKAEEAKGK